MERHDEEKVKGWMKVIWNDGPTHTEQQQKKPSGMKQHFISGATYAANAMDHVLTLISSICSMCCAIVRVSTGYRRTRMKDASQEKAFRAKTLNVNPESLFFTLFDGIFHMAGKQSLAHTYRWAIPCTSSSACSFFRFSRNRNPFPWHPAQRYFNFLIFIIVGLCLVMTAHKKRMRSSPKAFFSYHPGRILSEMCDVCVQNRANAHSVQKLIFVRLVCLAWTSIGGNEKLLTFLLYFSVQICCELSTLSNKLNSNISKLSARSEKLFAISEITFK